MSILIVISRASYLEQLTEHLNAYFFFLKTIFLLNLDMDSLNIKIRYEESRRVGMLENAK